MSQPDELRRENHEQNLRHLASWLDEFVESGPMVRAAADHIARLEAQQAAALALADHYKHDYEHGNVNEMFYRGWTEAMAKVRRALTEDTP